MMQRPLLVLGALLLLGPTDLAAGPEAEAEQLFRDGKRLMSESRFAEACAAFETSHQLDAAVTTLINLANCREKNQQLATAWALFLDVERKAREDKRLAGIAKTAKDRSAAIEVRLSFVTLAVPEASRIEGLEISRNGLPLAETLWNRAIPMDGGTYELTAQAPGRKSWSTTVTVPLESGKVLVDVPVLAESDAPLPKKGRSASVSVERSMAQERPSRFTTQRKISVTLAVAGTAAIGVAAVLGVQSNGYEEEAFTLCPATACNRADEANELLGKARSRSLVANVAFGVGGLAVLGAAVLWLTGGADASSESGAPAFSVRVSGEGMVGTFGVEF